MEKIAGKIVTHEREFEGTISFDPNSGLITNVKEGIDPEAHQFSDGSVIFPVLETFTSMREKTSVENILIRKILSLLVMLPSMGV